MTSEEITIRVGSEAALIYRNASEQDWRKLDALLSIRLRFADRPGRSLTEIMDDASRHAKENGLTPEILESILRDE